MAFPFAKFKPNYKNDIKNIDRAVGSAALEQADALRRHAEAHPDVLLGMLYTARRHRAGTADFTLTREFKVGLCVVRFSAGVYTLNFPIDGFSRGKRANGNEIIPLVNAVLNEWPLEGNYHVNGSYYFPVDGNQAIVGEGERLDAYDDVMVQRLIKRGNSRYNITYQGRRIEKPGYTRSDDVIYHNRICISGKSSKFGQQWQNIMIAKRFEEYVGVKKRKGDFLVRQHYAVQQLGAAGALLGLKPEQAATAERFAGEGVRSVLMYWAPGMGKTLGSWACMCSYIQRYIERYEVPLNEFEFSVTFLTMVSNLASHKFMAEFHAWASTLKCTEVRATGSRVSTIAAVHAFEDYYQGKGNRTLAPLFWTFTVEFKMSGARVKLHVLASTYFKYSRAVALAKYGNDDQRLSLTAQLNEVRKHPRVNVLDEAHELRGTGLTDLVNGKKAAVANRDKNIIKDNWAQPAGVKYTKIVWEALRKHSYYFEDSSDDTRNILLTATPVGNDINHLVNLYLCSQYSSDPEEEADISSVEAFETVSKQFESLIDDTGSANTLTNAQVNAQVAARKKNLEAMAVQFLSMLVEFEEKNGFFRSVLSCDSGNMPYQDFASSHIFCLPGATALGLGRAREHDLNESFSTKPPTNDDQKMYGEQYEACKVKEVPAEAREADAESQGSDDDDDTAAELRKNQATSAAKTLNYHLVRFAKAGVYYYVQEETEEPVLLPFFSDEKFDTTDSRAARNYANYFYRRLVGGKGKRRSDPRLGTPDGVYHGLLSEARQQSDTEFGDASAEVKKACTRYDAAELAFDDADKIRLEQMGNAASAFGEDARALGVYLKAAEKTKQVAGARKTESVARENAAKRRKDTLALMYGLFMGDLDSKRLKAYSPKYEKLLSFIDNMAAVTGVPPTPVLLFFKNLGFKTRDFSFSSCAGFEQYVHLRNNRGGVQYRFCHLDPTFKDTFDTIKHILSVYLADSAAVRADKEAKNITEIRRLIFEFILKPAPAEESERLAGDDNAHIVFAVSGNVSSDDFADWLFDTHYGLYNHPLNRFGGVARIIAGANRLSQSNDFRNTRYMFSMDLETDLVKLLQQFGRISRSSSPDKFPFYKYGFHKDHFPIDGTKPVVHYVSFHNHTTENKKSEDVGRLERPEWLIVRNIQKRQEIYNNVNAKLLTNVETGDDFFNEGIRVEGGTIAALNKVEAPADEPGNGDAARMIDLLFVGLGIYQ